MKHQEDTNEKVLFLTLDRGAKTIARSVGLPLAEFDITEFFNLKNTQTTARAKPKKKSKPYKRKRQNPIAILFNAIVQLIRGLFGLFVLTFVIFVVVNLIADNRDYKEQTKAFNHIEGDQNTVSIQVIGAKNDKDENTYEIKLEVMNQTSKKINWNGYYVNANNVIERKEQGNYDIKVYYKDGSEEALIGIGLQPREKKEEYIRSNGQLEDIDKIEIQYRVEGTSHFNVLTITPQN